VTYNGTTIISSQRLELKLLKHSETCILNGDGYITRNEMNKQHRKNAGFTLIELIIVMSILALVMSFVGPMTIQGYEKIQAKEELLSLQSWMKGNSYRSFATSKAGIITLNDKNIAFRYQVSKTDSELESSKGTYEGTQPLLSPDEQNQINSQNIISSIDFKFVTFPLQKISVNTFGLIHPATITVHVNDKERVIDLSKKINGSSK